MRWWMILLLIAGVLTLLLCMSVSFHICYRNKKLIVTFVFCGLRIQIYPRKNKKQTTRLVQQEKKALGKKKPNQKKPKVNPEKRPLIETVSLIVDLIKTAVEPTRSMLRRVRITAVDVTVIAGGEDAAQTAILYGQLCGAIYGGAAALKNLMTVKVKNLTVGYDFQKTEPEYNVFFKVKLRGFVAVAALARMIFNLMVNTFRRTAEDRTMSTEPAKA